MQLLLSIQAVHDEVQLHEIPSHSIPSGLSLPGNIEAIVSESVSARSSLLSLSFAFSSFQSFLDFFISKVSFKFVCAACLAQWILTC